MVSDQLSSGWASDSFTNADTGSGNVVYLRVFYAALLLQPCNPTSEQFVYFDGRFNILQCLTLVMPGSKVCTRGFPDLLADICLQRTRTCIKAPTCAPSGMHSRLVASELEQPTMSTASRSRLNARVDLLQFPPLRRRAAVQHAVLPLYRQAAVRRALPAQALAKRRRRRRLRALGGGLGASTLPTPTLQALPLHKGAMLTPCMA